MATRLLTLIAFIALPPALLGTTAGCGTASIEDQCEEIARDQCAACFDCAEGIDELEGAALCRLAPGTERSGCIERLQTRCQDQASTLEDSGDDLQACVESLNEVACEPLYGAWAQDRDYTTDACVFFL